MSFAEWRKRNPEPSLQGLVEHSADGWESVFKPVVVRYQGGV